MNKPIFPAVAIGIGMVVGEVAGNYFRGEEPSWLFVVVGGIGAGLIAYPIFRWKQSKTNSSSEPSDS